MRALVAAARSRATPRVIAALCVVAAPLLSACDGKRKTTASSSPASGIAGKDAALAPDAGMGVWRYPAARRVIAIGDVHGDMKATISALKLGGLIDEKLQWVGGDSVLVQTGDILDRGDDEQAIVDLLVSLKAQAKAAGGAVHLLNGNHELMNAAGDFRYVTPGGFKDFQDVPNLNVDDPRLSRLPSDKRARAAAWLPGGVYAKKVAEHPVAVVVGDTVFAHGGVTPTYAKDLDNINREVTQWLLGGGMRGMRIIESPDSPVWSRHFSDEPDPADCKMLAESLTILSAKRMVVGHTPQPKIRPACDQRVWRVDVGMAAHYGGEPEVLEITGDTVKALAAGHD